MSEVVIRESAGPAVPLALVREDWSGGERERAAAEAAGFKGKAGQLLVLTGADGRPERALFGLGASSDPMLLRQAPARLPALDYAIEEAGGSDPTQLALAWALGSYAFDRYKPSLRKPKARLVAPEGADLDRILRLQHACFMARDMVNTPAGDMGPLQIESIAREVAEQYGAEIAVVTGDALLEAGYPAVHAVGRAAAPHRQPRFIELSWGAADAPRVVLIGKGVVFDTGGLNIKAGAGMRQMKKDMGGAAHALALGRMVMAAGLPVRLSVLLPVAENAISGDAFRPGDVLQTRAGLTVEVGNTDAEGRLILADALTRAGELEPELTIDLATLTGAARIALGPELPPFYTDDEGLAGEIEAAARETSDPLWRMPLWPGYEDALESDVAELKNDPSGWAQAGSVTAALFLKRFAPKTGAWAHLDIFAWNPRSRPGWPEGGEAQAIRGLFRMLERRYGA